MYAAIDNSLNHIDPNMRLTESVRAIRTLSKFANDTDQAFSLIAAPRDLKNGSSQCIGFGYFAVSRLDSVATAKEIHHTACECRPRLNAPIVRNALLAVISTLAARQFFEGL